MLNNKPSFPSSTPIPTANVFKDVNVIIIVPMRTSLSRKKKKSKMKRWKKDNLNVRIFREATRRRRDKPIERNMRVCLVRLENELIAHSL